MNTSKKLVQNYFNYAFRNKIRKLKLNLRFNKHEKPIMQLNSVEPIKTNLIISKFFNERIYFINPHDEKEKDNINDNYDNFKLVFIPLSLLIFKFYQESILKCDDEIVNLVKPYLGASITKVDQGMQIVMIKTGSPAEKAGLKIKDIIVEIEGTKTNSINEYYVSIGNKKGKKKVKFLKFKDEEGYDLSEILINFE